MLSIYFSCTQRLMTPINPDVQKNGRFLESRVSSLAASLFLFLDMTFHLLAGTFKGFVWARNRVLHKITPNDYYPHFVKALSYAPLIPFGTALGMICPSAFQSKKLQEYLGWKVIHIRSQTSQTENVEVRFNLHPSSNVIYPLIDQKSEGDNLSLTSEEFQDTLEDFDSLEEPALQLLKTQLQAAKEEITRIKPQSNLLDKILSPLAVRHSYNQVLVMQKLINKSILDTPAIYHYVSDPIKEEINNAFQKEFAMDFCEFCIQENPDIDSASAIFTQLLGTHHFYAFSYPTEAAISTFINTLFGMT